MLKSTILLSDKLRNSNFGNKPISSGIFKMLFWVKSSDLIETINLILAGISGILFS